MDLACMGVLCRISQSAKSFQNSVRVLNLPIKSTAATDANL